MVLFLLIQFLYLLKIHHCSFKVYPIHIFKAFWSYSFALFYKYIISFSQVFSALSISIFSTISFSASVLYHMDSAQAIIHLQLTALASTMKLQLLKFCSNNFPCISSLPCVRLKIVAMTYIRIIPNTIEVFLQYLALLYQYH